MKYSLINFIDDVIQGCCVLAVMMVSIIVSVAMWGMYHPQIKSFLLTVQNFLFGWV